LQFQYLPKREFLTRALIAKKDREKEEKEEEEKEEEEEEEVRGGRVKGEGEVRGRVEGEGGENSKGKHKSCRMSFSFPFLFLSHGERKEKKERKTTDISESLTEEWKAGEPGGLLRQDHERQRDSLTQRDIPVRAEASRRPLSGRPRLRKPLYGRFGNLDHCPAASATQTTVQSPLH